MSYLEGLRKRLPDDFRLFEAGKRAVIAKEGWEEVLRELGGKDRREREEAYPGFEYLRGRGRPMVLPTARGKVVVRHYYHGGVLRRLTGDLFLGASRPLQELRLLVEAEGAGINVPEVLGLLIERGPAGLTRADLVTLFIPGSIDLLSYYRGEAPRRKREVIAETAREVLRMHRSGIFHGDLQLKNILLQETPFGRRVFILDFDKARRGPTPDRRAVLKNLLRFYRSFKKMQQVKPGISDRDPVRFLLVYSPTDKNFRREVARRVGRCRFHSWKWRLAGKVRGDIYARPLDQ